MANTNDSNKDEKSGETHEQREKRIEGNRQEKKDDSSNTGASRRRGTNKSGTE